MHTLPHYIHACMHACTHTHIHTYTHTHIHTYIHACMHACMHAHMNKYIQSFICSTCIHTLHYIALRYTTLHCIALHYIYTLLPPLHTATCPHHRVERNEYLHPHLPADIQTNQTNVHTLLPPSTTAYPTTGALERLDIYIYIYVSIIFVSLLGTCGEQVMCCW